MHYPKLALAWFGVFFAHQQAQAVCLNPFGCEPQTRQECIANAKEARTEAAARAHLAECYKLPRVTETICKNAEAQWVGYMRAHAGKEWDWPDSDWSIKQECKVRFGGMFAASKWVTKSYCASHTEQIRRNLDGIQIESGRSVKLEETRRKVPALAQLDDRSFVAAIQRLYYPDMTTAEIAGRLGIDDPTDVGSVSLACHQLAGGSLSEWTAAEVARRHNASTIGLNDPIVLRTDAVAKGREVVLRYVLKPSANANPTILREQVVPKTCQANAASMAFKQGLYYTFEYSDVHGRQLSRFSVGAAECRL